MKALLVLALLTGSAAAQQSEEYDPTSPTWNGLSIFVSLAEGQNYEVVPVAQLEWGDLGPDDILFLVWPNQKVEASKLAAFVEAGGNVVIADDFGESKEALARLGLVRADNVTPRASKFQDGRMWAPIAVPKAAHPIAQDITEVVTNHPSALTQVDNATIVLGFDEGAVVVAGERGNGRFVAVSDPSIFINRMLQYHGNVSLSANILRWLDRHDGRPKRIMLLRGDVPMFGEPDPYIYDPRGGSFDRSIADLNSWLSHRADWLLTPGAMKALAATLAILLLLLAVLALPVRRGPRIDGAWLRFGRPARRDEPYALVANSDRGAGSCLVLATVLRDQVQTLLAEALGTNEPLYTMTEQQLAKALTQAKGRDAATALARVYKRLRALPSRSQAAAPWSSGHLARREFDTLYKDVAELCRTLGAGLEQEAA